MGLSTGWVKPKTIKLVVVASWLSTQHSGERAKAGWLGIMIMSSIGKLKKCLILVTTDILNGGQGCKTQF
jgi:hypothetical protein